MPAPGPIDRCIGRRIRARREIMGLTQVQLAQKVGVRFQMMSRYEGGVCTISASLLWTISGVLEQPIEAFFVGLPKQSECVS